MLLKLENLRVAFKRGKGLPPLQVVRGVDLEIGRGEIVGVVGESGSGKSVTALSLARLHDGGHAVVDADRLEFDGMDLLNATEKELCGLRGKRMAYIFQNPVEALCPHMRIKDQFKEGFEIHGMDVGVHMSEVAGLLVQMGLEDAPLILDKYPHQLSGGQAQRVMIAMAVSLRPDLLIADEPTSAIDASLSQVIVELLRVVNETYGISILLITHDFDLARSLSHKLMVFYGGLVMESRPTAMFGHGRHPYSKALIGCVESLNSGDERLTTLPGAPPEPTDFKDACPFAERCGSVTPECLAAIPSLVEDEGGIIRCIHPYDGEVVNHG